MKDGLSNVLFWVFYRFGHRKTRVQKFRNLVLDFQLQAFSSLMKVKNFNPIDIKKIGFPQFSQFSFISKILMFINQNKYVTLDKKIMKLRDPLNQDIPLTRIPYSKNDTAIRVSTISTKYYLEWCELCRIIAQKLNNDIIAVDVKR
jgi:hypothetical protein